MEDHVQRYQTEYGLELCPDFQRGHVWTDTQATRFVEFVFRGGESNKTLYFNHPGWSESFEGHMVLVDGLQRLTACLRFLRNELPIFGCYRRDFTDKLPMLLSLRFNVNNLKTRAQVLQWYIDMNAGGVVHADEEIERV